VAKYLIVNADDFNLTAGVTRGILDGHRDGIITSTTVMVNLPGLAQARDLARGVPRLGLGLHVNLTLGAPVLSAERVPSLVDASGRFFRDRNRLGEAGDPREIRDEAAAQAGRFVEVFGLPPTHMDTHYHMHRLLPVLTAILDVAAELRIPVRALTPDVAEAIRRRGLVAVDRAVGDVGQEPYWTIETLLKFIRTLEPGVSELMCHPGYADGSLSTSSYCAQRECELRALCDPRAKAALTAAGVALIDYRALSAMSGSRP
jgi:predicted glycoside hydrolase/deacetylase ChbG (UPF0249 family)